MKKFRFFYHYRRQIDSISIHFRGKCHICENVKCLVPTESKRNKTQPKIVIQGFCEKVIFNGKNGTIC